MSLKIKEKNLIEKDQEVGLWDGSGTAKMSDCLYTIIGFVLKNDPDLKDDCLYPNSTHKILINSKTIKNYTKVYFDIDDFGEFCDVRYTSYIREFNRANQLLINKDNNIIIGHYSLLKNNNFNKYYFEDLYHGMFYKIDLKNTFKKHMKIKGININCDTDSFIESMKDRPSTYINTLGKKYHYGIELETISGIVPSYIQNFVYFSSVHDGSLRQSDDGETYGKEYVSPILYGDQGLKQIRILSNELTKRCLVNKQCALHVHLSQVTFNKENIIYMFFLYQKIQEEIYNMIPKSRRFNEYCKKLPTILEDVCLININKSQREYYIDYYYNQIIEFLSGKFPLGYNLNKKKDHPKGSKCAYDHSSARYCWVNFVPSVFNTRNNEQYTIEFRPAPGTTSYFKIKNWLLICFALVDIVENHKSWILNTSIDNYNLNDILKQVYNEKAIIVINYVNKRKEKFKPQITREDEIRIEEQDYEDNEINENLSIKNL